MIDLVRYETLNCIPLYADKYLTVCKSNKFTYKEKEFTLEGFITGATIFNGRYYFITTKSKLVVFDGESLKEIHTFSAKPRFISGGSILEDISLEGLKYLESIKTSNYNTKVEYLSVALDKQILLFKDKVEKKINIPDRIIRGISPYGNKMVVVGQNSRECLLFESRTKGYKTFTVDGEYLNGCLLGGSSIFSYSTNILYRHTLVDSTYKQSIKVDGRITLLSHFTTTLLIVGTSKRFYILDHIFNIITSETIPGICNSFILTSIYGDGIYFTVSIGKEEKESRFLASSSFTNEIREYKILIKI